MATFIIRRILYIIAAVPVLLLIFLGLFRLSPVDTVEQLIDAGDFQMNALSYRNVYQKTAEKYALNRPIFYWSVGTLQWNQNYFDLALPAERAFYQRIVQGGIQYEDVQGVYEDLLGFEPKGDTVREKQQLSARELRASLVDADIDKLLQKTNDQLVLSEGSDHDVIRKIDGKLRNAQEARKVYRSWIPAIYWHGSDNAFHNTLERIASGDFGISLRDGRTVGSKIWQAFFLTFFLIVMASVTVFPLGIWLGRRMSYVNEKWLIWIERLLLALASIPVFWLGTLLLVFFTTPEYGRVFHIFSSSSSFGFRMDDGLVEAIIRNGKQLVLPILCFLLSDLAIVMRQTHQLYKNEATKAYILTARMKGLLPSERAGRHITLNARPQLLTMISSGIASAFAGSLVIEYIYNIPGMGRLLLDSVRFGDRPVLLGIVLLLFVTSSLIFLVADIMYRSYDPRIMKEDAV